MVKIKLKNKKKRIKLFVFLTYLFIFIIVMNITFYYLLNKNLFIDGEVLTKYLLKNININDNKEKMKIKINTLEILNMEYFKPNKVIKKANIIEKNNDYLIYLYNTHQTEEYRASDIVNNSINPTVTINNYILKDVFNKNGLNTLVEERSIKDILNLNNLNYAGSYKASRTYLEDVKKSYKTLEYFIDIHRDSLSKNRTTISIDDKNYASVIFIVGMENENHDKNYEFTEKIHNKINEKVNISKGILQKGGKGVNGVYNQDLSSHTILIEIGGVDNTIEEVMNTALVVGEAITEVIKDERG